MRADRQGREIVSRHHRTRNKNTKRRGECRDGSSGVINTYGIAGVRVGRFRADEGRETAEETAARSY